MSGRSPVEDLASSLFADVAVVAVYCRSRAHPQRSFGQESPRALLPQEPPQSLLRAKDAILEATTGIKQLVQDPSDVLLDILVQQQQFTCLQWICRFRILFSIPLPPAAASYGDIARAAKVPEATLRSVARMAMTANFLRETDEGNLAHNALSASFVENPNLSTWLSYMVDRTVPVMSAFAKATERWGDSVKGNETAYNIAMETDLSFFEHLKSRPDLSSAFDAYMKSQASVNSGTSVEFLLEGFDWASLGEATVVDVGGGGADASIVLAKTYPKLHFVVQDLAHTIDNIRAKAEYLPSDITQRIQFQVHDFFSPQPETKAEIYLLRMIVHDWPDADAAKILKNIVQVMTLGSRIVIMDMVLPAAGSGPRTFEAALRQKDLTMKQVLNAREREVEDWRSLILGVDPNLKIRAIRRPHGCQHSVIELGLEDSDGSALNGC